MNLLGRFILVCLIISALQGLMAVLAIATALFFLWGLFFRTEQTVGLVAVGLLLSALQVHPLLTIGAIVCLTVVLLIRRTKMPPESPMLALPPPDGQREK